MQPIHPKFLLGYSLLKSESRSRRLHKCSPTHQSADSIWFCSGRWIDLAEKVPDVRFFCFSNLMTVGLNINRTVNSILIAAVSSKTL